MTDDHETGPKPTEGRDRRSFLRTAGIGTGALAATGSLPGVLGAWPAPPLRSGRGEPHVVVVGAGAFGGWSALHLREMGARVTLIDMYGPGNSRSTSGDETRGVRTSYAGRELWTSWAIRSIERWAVFDEEWADIMGSPLFFPTGDVILAGEWAGRLQGTAETWDAVGGVYERLEPDEVAHRWPQIRVEGFGAALFEPGAGVVRARAACQRVAAVFRQTGGEIRLGRAAPAGAAGGRLAEVALEGGDRLGADLFVFALGPWFPKAFPEVMAERIRIPMGHVYYFGTPPGDDRFTFPNLPSWGIPGVTGWPTLPPDHRGFRVRTGGRSHDDPDTSTRWIPESYLDAPRRVLTERFPDLADQPLLETRACHYESSNTRDWIVDRHPEWDNVWLLGGGNAEGFKFGPVIGELAAGRVLDRDLHPDLAGEFRLGDV